MEEELLHAYLAGFFDGDGSINKNKKTGRWYVNVTNTVRDILQEYVDTFGGTIHKHRDAGHTSAGGITSTKPIYRWYASGAVGIAFCQASLPYLIIKKEKVEQALQESFGLKNWPRAVNPSDSQKNARRCLVVALKRIVVQERRREALRLRLLGASYEKIRKALGYKSRSGAFGAVNPDYCKARYSKHKHPSL